MTKISFNIPDMESDDRGVSPVIGVILMVAVTVILAALVATFVLGFGDSTTQSASAGVEVDTVSSDEVNVTVISFGENTDTVECVDSGASASSVGDTITCDVGDNVVASGPDVQNATIRTNIGN